MEQQCGQRVEMTSSNVYGWKLVQSHNIIYDAKVDTQSADQHDVTWLGPDWKLNTKGDGILHVEGTDSTYPPADDLLDWHIRFGHMPIWRLQSLANDGIIPQRLSKYKISKCTSFMYGKITKKPWRYKHEARHINKDTEVVGGLYRLIRWSRVNLTIKRNTNKRMVQGCSIFGTINGSCKFRGFSLESADWTGITGISCEVQRHFSYSAGCIW
jgi:hypothetical protein